MREQNDAALHWGAEAAGLLLIMVAALGALALATYDPSDPSMTLGPEESASVEDMIASFTIHGAFASFLEDSLKAR